jgi:hypothetical protein
MSRFFDELESQLRSAAKSVAGAPDVPRVRRRRRRWWGWWPGSMDLAPVLATVVVVVLIVGAALVLLRGSRPQPTPPSASPPPHSGLAALIEKTPAKRLRREFSYIAAATKPLLRSPVCRVRQPIGTSVVHGPVDPTLLSLLAVLRRPATPADRVNPSLFTGIPDFYAASARRAFSAGGETYYVAVSGFDESVTVPSDRCFALQSRALARYLPNIPPAMRAQTQALQAGYIAYTRNTVNRGPHQAVCLIDTGRSDNSALCGTTATEIQDGTTPDDDNGVEIGVVPDGVASVTLKFPAAGAQPAHSVTGRVRGNIYAIRVGGAPQPLFGPDIAWHSGDGRVLKTIGSPTLAEQIAACRADPIPCALVQDGGLAQVGSSSSETAPARSGAKAH